MSVFNLDVVGSNKLAETGLLDVRAKEHGAERGTSCGEVGGWLEGLGLTVDEKSVTVRTGTFSWTRTSVVGATSKHNYHACHTTHMVVALP